MPEQTPVSKINGFDPVANMEKIRVFTNRDDIYPIDLYESLFLQAPWGIALIDSLTAKIYEANPAYAAIAGRTVQELKTMCWTDFTHPDDIRPDLDSMAAMNVGKIAGFRMRKRYIQPDGTMMHIDMVVVPVKVVDPTKPRHLCMINDISVRLEIEEKLAILAEEMLSKNENLQFANTELEASNIKLNTTNSELKLTNEVLKEINKNR